MRTLHIRIPMHRSAVLNFVVQWAWLRSWQHFGTALRVLRAAQIDSARRVERADPRSHAEYPVLSAWHRAAAACGSALALARPWGPDITAVMGFFLSGALASA